MKLKDVAWLGIKGISERKTRTALTVLTVVIGVAAIVALISLVSGVSLSVSKSLESIGPSTLFLTPKGSTLLTAAQVAEIEGFPYVSTVIPIIEASGNVTVSGQSESVTIVGINNYSIIQAIGSLNFYEGTLYNQSTLPVGVVGYDIAFPTTTQNSSSVTVGQPLYVTLRSAGIGGASKTAAIIPVGILNSYGSAFFVSPDSSVFVPLTEAEALTGRQSYSALLVIANSTSQVSSLDTLLTDVLGSSVSVTSVQALASTVSSIIGSISLLLGSVAGVSLLVAGISILSIMMVSVTERTKEIGTLKALGFKKSDILTLFLTEAVVIGFAGGVIGVAVGGGGAYALGVVLSHASTSSTAPSTSGASGFGTSSGAGARGSGGFSGGAPSGSGGAVFVGSGSGASSSSSSSSASITPNVSIETVILAIVVAVLVSVISSLYPAWKAASVDPITALRTE